jgi:drug/metabolite transporter (DMT)-like permease
MTQPSDNKETARGFVATRQQDNLNGALLLAVATFIYALEGAILRWISHNAVVWQVLCLRAMMQLALVALWCAARGHVPRVGKGRIHMHLARGLASLANWWLGYYTYLRLDLALANVLSFASALFVVLLARPILGETVRLSSWIATLMGFGGIAIATGVGAVPLDVGVLFGLGGALGGAMVTFLNRSMSQAEDSKTMVFWISVIIVAGSAPMAILTWQPLTLKAFWVIMLSGLLGVFGMYLGIEAYARAEAAFLAPVGYIRLVFAIALGFFLFGEVPELRMLAGSVVVICATLYVTRSEQLRRRRGRAAK